ncbi:Gar1/Naf1 RNA binding region-domain-containing protein, partial [Pseudomassariella vexata]
MEIDQLEPIHQADSSTVDAVDAQPSPPSLTQGLEALLGGLDPLPDETDSAADQNVEMQDSEEQAQQPENVEWEEDSSPYASSSDSSSSDDSDDDDDSDDGQPLLNPEEMARILMEAGSDDEGEGKAKDSGAGCQLRTKNEQAEEVIPKPDVTITPEMKVEELGNIEHIVDNTVVIKANTTGEYRVLDAGSVLCNKERTVIAAIADLIGSVREPRYIARFTNEEEMKAFNLSMDTTIYYAPDHA